MIYDTNFIFLLKEKLFAPFTPWLSDRHFLVSFRILVWARAWGEEWGDGHRLPGNRFQRPSSWRSRVKTTSSGVVHEEDPLGAAKRPALFNSVRRSWSLCLGIRGSVGKWLPVALLVFVQQQRCHLDLCVINCCFYQFSFVCEPESD